MYTHDDDMAQGVVQAIRNAGRDDEMFLTGVGGSQDAMKQIKEGGLYRATFLYNPNMAASAVNMARLIAPRRGLPRARAAGGPAPAGRAGRRRHEGQRRRVREVRVQLIPLNASSAAGRRGGARRALVCRASCETRHGVQPARAHDESLVRFRRVVEAALASSRTAARRSTT